jgi:hypothetical protein
VPGGPCVALATRVVPWCWCAPDGAAGAADHLDTLLVARVCNWHTVEQRETQRARTVSSAQLSGATIHVT